MKIIRYTKQSTRILRKIQPKQRAAIISKINAYGAGEIVDVKKLSGSEFLRIRVGQWRVLIDDDGIVIVVEKIAPRGSVYKD